MRQRSKLRRPTSSSPALGEIRAGIQARTGRIATRYQCLVSGEADRRTCDRSWPEVDDSSKRDAAEVRVIQAALVFSGT
jgi:hypothetical protein